MFARFSRPNRTRPGVGNPSDRQTSFRPPIHKTPCNSDAFRALLRRTQPVFRIKSSPDDPGGGASSDPGKDDGFDKVDIDLLAKKLSEEAEKLRRRQSESGDSVDFEFEGDEEGDPKDIVFELDLNDDDGDENDAGIDEDDDDVVDSSEVANGNGEVVPESDQVESLRYQPEDAEALVVAEFGSGGFSADDFELIQQLGYLSIQEFQPSGTFLTPSQVKKENKAVIAFVARYYSGRPYEFPITALLKEYMSAAKGVARNELTILNHLCGIPDAKWQAASCDIQQDPPVVPVLGYFIAAPSEAATELDDEGDGKSIWLVYKWEGLKPLSGYWDAKQEEVIGAWPWEDPKGKAQMAKRKMLTAIFRGILNGLAFCHTSGIVHGSLGSGSVFLTGFDDRDAEDLIVKLDNFGFAQQINQENNKQKGGSGPAVSRYSTDGTVMGFDHDLKAAGLLMLETLVLSLTDVKDEAIVTRESIERLVMDVFRGDFQGLREYCENEPDWSEAVEFLEQENGAWWDLLEKLLEGTTEARQLLDTFLGP